MYRDLSPCRAHSTIPFHHSSPVIYLILSLIDLTCIQYKYSWQPCLCTVPLLQSLLSAVDVRTEEIPTSNSINIFFIDSFVEVFLLRSNYGIIVSRVGSRTVCQFFLPLCYAHMLSFCPVILSQQLPTMLTLCSPSQFKFPQFSSLSDLKSMVACQVEVNTVILG